MGEIEEYISKETWSVAEYLSTDNVKEKDLPTRENILKLLKLSGLPAEGTDIEGIRGRLGKQLSFINKLHRISLEDDTIDPMDARLLPREGMALSYDELMSEIMNQQKDSNSGETNNSWDSTKLAKVKKDGYFVIRGGLMTNRD